MATFPVKPVAGVAGRAGPGEQGSEQVLDRGDGSAGPCPGRRGAADQAALAVRPGVGAVAQQGSGDGADGQGGHDQHGVAGDRMVEADLRLVEAEAVLAELEIFFLPAI